MCVVCAELRPWTPECDYAALDDAAQASGGLRAATSAAAAAAPPSLSASAIGSKLLTDYWNVSTPRSFDAKAGDTLTYDVSALTSAGRTLARAAIEEWSAVTGLEFREVGGGFRPTDVRREVGDAAASTATSARMAVGEAFDGTIGASDRDWVRLSLPGSKIVRIAVEGSGSDPLDAPGLALFDANGGAIALGVHHTGSSAEVTVKAPPGGGTYYAQVVGHGGSKGGYRLSLAEPGGSGSANLTFDDDRSGAHAELVLSGSRILSADINVSRDWLDTYGTGRESYSFHTYLHEIGHALGLGHPGDYNRSAAFADDAEYRNDSWQTSVMSYFSQTENPHVDADKAYVVTPMIGDIEAVRRLYGSAQVRAGDTTYGEGSDAGGMLARVAGSSKALAFTILDTGGRDRIVLSSQSADQTLDLRPGRVSDVMGRKGNMVIDGRTVIEDARLGSGDDRVIGNDARNDLRGGSGDDQIEGGAGRDKLFGEADADRLRGESGSDRLYGGSGNDRLYGGSGDDRLDGGSGRDRLYGDGGHDTLYGGSGSDRLYGGSGDDRLDGGSWNDRLYGDAGSDRLSGGEGSDRLYGGSGSDRLYGESGHDRLDGGSGSDRIYGGSGDDRLDGGSSSDRLYGGSGSDLLRGETGNDVLRGDSGDDVLYGHSGRDTLHGGTGKDYLSGGSGSDAMSGNGGADTLRGGTGSDRMWGGSGSDRMSGDEHDDQLMGGSGWDRLDGDAGDDRLWGNSGNDRLDGGSGRDRLDGGAGNDWLKGGSGDDIFVFAGVFGQDRIRDFDARDDGERVDLSRVATIAGFGDLWHNHLRRHGDDMIIEAGGAGRIVLDDVAQHHLDPHDFIF